MDIFGLARLSDADQGGFFCAGTRFWRRQSFWVGAVYGFGAALLGASRAGIQEWLSFYLKSPMDRAGLYRSTIFSSN